MDEVELEQLAARVEAAAALVALRRASLGPVASTWWEGPAAEAHRAAVEERRVRLGLLADELGGLAVAVRSLAAAVRAEAASDDLGRAS